MKKTGILNPALLSMLGNMGHTDYITISDRGYPVPQSQERIDLALTDDIPKVLDVLRAVHEEFVIDRILITFEMEQCSKHRFEEITAEFAQLKIEQVSHMS